MGKVVSLSSLRDSVTSNSISEKKAKTNLFNQAFDELHRETGLDHQKIIMGDEKERKRLKMRQYQEALKEG